MNPSITNDLLIVSAETSSTLYAKRILEYWQEKKITISCFGVGSENMEKLDFERFGKSEEMAVVGFKEVLAHYKDIKKVYNKLLEEVDRRKTKYALLLDYPEFNLKLSKDLHRRGVKVYYFISPQLWAWRKSRIQIVKKYIHKMLVIFPFEKEFYNKHGVECEFVGHPLIDELQSDFFDKEQNLMHRQRYALNKQKFTLAILPGSRKSEIENILPCMLDTAQILQQKKTDIQFVLLTAPGVKQDIFLPYLENYDLHLNIIQGSPFEMLRIANGALVASGTATIVTGLMQIPMVVVYKMKWLSALIAKTLVKGTKYFAMINLVFDKEIVPERFQEKADPKHIADLLIEKVIDMNSNKKTSEELKALPQLLGGGGAVTKVADILVRDIQRESD